MAFNIGELFGTIRIQGAAEATSQVRGVGTQFTRTGEAAGRAAGMVDEAAAALTGSGRAAAAASSGTAKYRAAQLSAIAATERYNAVLGQEDASLARLASAEAAVIRANERLAASTPVAAMRTTTAATNEAVASTGRLSGAVASGAKMAAQLGLVFGAFEAVKKAIDISKEATNFKADMVKIQTQAGASAMEINQFSGALLKMAPGVAQAPEDLATSLYHVYSATKTLGYTGPQMLKAVEIAAKGATASGADLEETTNALTATMVSGLGSVNNMSRAMGALNAIVGAGDMKLEDLNGALGTGILAVAKTFGVTLDQAGAALAVFGDNNIRGAKAATTLRMVIQDLTKPAATASEVLGKIGLSVTSLRDDLQKGGLSLALDDLKQKLNAAGVTGDKVGGFIEDAFTKKAGVGLAMLLNNLDQYQEKQTTIADQAGSFGDKWKATTATARYALDRLWTSIQAGGIILAGKLTPAIATAAMWLGTAVPHALSVLSDALGPTVHLIGAGLVGAWHALGAVLGPIVGFLGDVGHLMAENKPLVTGVTVAVLSMWAAFKGVAIATAAIEAIKGALLSLRASMMLAQVAGMSSFSGIAAAISPTQAAVAGLGIVIGAAAYEWQKHRQYAEAAIAAENADIQSLTDTIQQDSGAVGQNTKAWIENKLTQAGAYDQASKLGVSFNTVTAAAMGQKSALKQINDALNGMSAGEKFKVFRDGAGTILELGDATGKAAGKVSTLNELNAAGAVKAGLLDRGAERVAASAASTVDPLTKSGDAAKGMGNAMYSAFLSGKKLAQALQDLGSGQISRAQAYIQFRQTLLGLKDALDKNDQSIQGATKAALQNRSAILDALDAAKAHAAALQQQGASAKAVQSALLGDINQLAATAHQAGVSTSQFKALLRQMNLTPKDIRTALHVNTYQAMQGVKAVQTAINNINGEVVIHTTYQGGGGNTVHAKATGGIIRGPGSGTSDTAGVYALSNGEAVIPAKSVSRNFDLVSRLIQEGRGAASGGIVTKTVNGKKVYEVGGHQYTTRTAAQNAINSQTASTGETRASGALTNIGLDSSSFSWAKFQKQIVAASQAIKDALAAGISHSQYVSLQQRLARDQKRGEELEHKLGVQAGQQATKLGRSVSNLKDVSSKSDVMGAIHSLEHTLQQAGLRKDFIKGLADENKQISALVASRNRAAAMLAKANAAMAKAKSAEMQDFRSFRSATVGGFDITSAGQDSNGNVTRGSLIAAQNQDLARTKAWVSGVDKLAAMKIFPAAYLRQIVGQGPASLGTVRALLSMRHGQLAQFASQERQIFNLGTDVSQHVVARLDTKRLRDADKRVQAAQKREDKAQQRLEDKVDAMGQAIVAAIKDPANRKMRAEFGTGSLHKLEVLLESSTTHHNRVTRRGGRG